MSERKKCQAGPTVPPSPERGGRTADPRPLAGRRQRRDPVDVEVIGRKPSTPSNAGHVPTAFCALPPYTPRSAYPMQVYLLAGWIMELYVAQIIVYLLAG